MFYLQFTNLEERVIVGDMLCEKQRKKERERETWKLVSHHNYSRRSVCDTKSSVAPPNTTLYTNKSMRRFLQVRTRHEPECDVHFPGRPEL